jgi:hypothetical protein
MRKAIEGITIVIACYLAVTLSFWWVYKRCGMSKEDALLFSIDTIACKGRMAEPTKGVPPAPIESIRWWSAAQSLFGHLGLSLAVGMIFSSYWAGVSADPDDQTGHSKNKGGSG